MRPTDESLLNKDKIYKFIRQFYREMGFTPTFQEIANFMGFTYRQQVQYYTDKLKKEGKILVTPRIRRSIKIL